MHIVIEFYRTRDRDDAHAVVSRETAEAAAFDDARRSRDFSRNRSTCRNNLTS